MIELYGFLFYASLLITAANCANVTALGKLCNETADSCGDNASCQVMFPCLKGRCGCDSGYRPLNLFDCVAILEPGASCNASNSGLLPDFSDCINSTVTCRSNFTGESRDHLCDSNKKQFGSFGETCNDSNACDGSKGLQCAKTGKCDCKTNLYPQEDGTCRTSTFGEDCLKNEECRLADLGASSPSSTAAVCRGNSDISKQCTCDMSNNETRHLKTQIVVISKMKKDDRDRNLVFGRAVCLRVPRNATVELSQGAKCTVFELSAFGDDGKNTTTPEEYCNWLMNYSCLRCPEDEEERANDASFGRCRRIYQEPVVRGVAGKPSGSSTNKGYFSVILASVFIAKFLA